MDSARATTKASVGKQRSAAKPAPKRVVRSAAPVAIPSVLRAAIPPGGGELPPDVRTEMEARFGQDFGNVVVHANPVAAELAQRRNANAYTVGEHIIFAQHRFAPGLPEGRRLIAHELAHVVQQRRGGAPPSAATQSTLESHAERAAAAVPGVASVVVPGAAGVAVMCDRSGRKKKRAWDDEEEFGEDAQETDRRAADRQRTQQRKEGRRTAGKDDPQIIVENAERELRALEDQYNQPGAQTRSDKQKLRDLKRYQALLDDLPNDTPEQRLKNSQRQGAFDELQRTPTRTAGKPQDQYVAGGPKLPFMELRPGTDHFAQPDYSIYRRRADGTFERVHVNLKSDRLERMNRSQAIARARAYADQAVRNSWHLPDTGAKGASGEGQSEGIYVRFAHTPSPEIQEAMLAELFRVGSPIKAVSFGGTTYHEEHYRGARAAARLGPKTRKQIARERAAAKKQAARKKAADKKAAAKKRAADKKAAAKERAKKRAADKKARAKERAAKKAEERKAATKKAAEKREAAKKAREERAAAKKREREEKAAAKRKAAAETAAKKNAEAEERKRKRGEMKATTAPKRSRTKKTAGTPDSDVAETTPRRTRKATKKPPQRVRIATPENAEPEPQPETRVRVGPKVRIATVDDEAAREQQAELEADAEQEAAPRKKRQTMRAAPPTQTRREPDVEADVETAPASKRTQRKAAPVKATPVTPSPKKVDAPTQTEAPVTQKKPTPGAKKVEVKPQQQKSPPTGPVQQTPRKKATPPPPPKPPAVKKPNVQVSPKPPTTGTKAQGGKPGGAIQRKPPPRGGVSTPSNVSVQTQSHFGDQVKITVEETTGDSDKPYLVTTRLTVHASGMIGGSSSGDTHGGAHVSASGMHSIAYSTRMSETEKNEYLRNIAGGRGGPQPALSIVELIASNKLDEAAAAIDQANKALASPDAFAQRAEGDTVEVTSEGDVSVGVSAGKAKPGGASIGGQVQIESGEGRSVLSTRVGDKELITVVLRERSGRTLGASGGFGVAGMGYTDQRQESRERHVSFLLDPKASDYAARRSEIIAAKTLDELNAIAARQPQLAFGRGQHQDKSQVGTIEATVLGFGLAMDQGGFYGEGVTEDPDGRVRSVTGGSVLGGSFVAGGQRIGPESTTDSFTGWTRDDNTGEGVTQSEHKEVDWARTGERLLESGAANPIATAVDIARGNKPIAQERVDTSGAILQDDSFSRVAKVAQDKQAWDKAWDLRGVSHGAYEEWEATRQKVLAANGDRYKIQQALAEWEKGDSGRSGDVERLAGETGVAFEFPDEIADQKPVYDSLVAHNPLARPQALLAQGNAAQALKELEYIDGRLGRLLHAIQMHESAINSPSKFAEMQQRISKRRDEVRAAIVKTKPAVREHGPQPGDPDFVGPVLPEHAAQAKADQEKEQAAAERKMASDQIHDLVGTCLSNRDKESRTFLAIEDELDDFYVNLRYVFDQINSLKPMYETWDGQIAQLKTLYPKIGDSPDRADQFKPNRTKWQQLYNQSLK